MMTFAENGMVQLTDLRGYCMNDDGTPLHLLKYSGKIQIRKLCVPRHEDHKGLAGPERDTS